MDRPQKYDPGKGLQGNIEDALWSNQYNSNGILNEEIVRKTQITDSEQEYTDSYLDLVEAQQNISELTLALIELEARVKALEGK